MRACKVINPCLLFISLFSILISIPIGLTGSTDSNDQVKIDTSSTSDYDEIKDLDQSVSQVNGPLTRAAPAASVELSYYYATADVSSGSDDIVYFEGVVSVQILGIGQEVQLLQVNLVVDAGELDAIITPETAVVDPKVENEVPFEVLINIPRSLCALEQYGMFVYGNAVTYPGARQDSFQSDNATIEVVPYHNIQYMPHQMESFIQKGEQDDITITVINEGNIPDTIGFVIQDQESLFSSGIQCEVGNSSIEVTEGTSENVNFVISINEDCDMKEQQITVILTSKVKKEEGGSSSLGEIIIDLKIDGGESDGGSGGGGSSISQVFSDDSEGRFNLLYIILIIIIIMIVILGVYWNRKKDY